MCISNMQEIATVVHYVATHILLQKLIPNDRRIIINCAILSAPLVNPSIVLLCIDSHAAGANYSDECNRYREEAR